jgi:outer membrane lipoprotein-sorting protein
METKMRKNKTVFLLGALALVLVMLLAGCKSEQKTTTAAALPTTTQPAASVSKPAATTASPTAATVSPAAATTLPAVTTTAPTATAAQPQASGVLDKTVQDLKDKFQQISSVKFDMVMSNGMMTSKMYQKQHRSRMETNTMGMNLTIITDGDKQIMYTWMVDQNKATITDLTKEKPITAQANIQDFWDSDLVVKGTETLDDKTCTVVEYNKTTTEGKMTGKIWVWQEKGLPLRMDTTMTSTSEKGMNLTVTIEFKNYEFVDLADNLFELPADVEIVDKLNFFPSTLPSGIPSNLPTGAP